MKRQNIRKAQIGVGAYPKCEECNGTGYRMYDTEHGQKTRPCDCWIKVAIAKNIKFTWPYMAHQVSPVKDSPLIGLDKSGKNAFITAKQKTLAAHLKGCMISHGVMQDDPYWWVEVSSDKDIIEAWLYTARLQGKEIYDADVASQTFMEDSPRSIKELALGADLMIIQLGKKISPNKETYSTFLEALEYRIDQNLLTWIVVSPRHALEELQADSEHLREDLEDYGFEDIVLDSNEDDTGEIEDVVKPQKSTRSSVRQSARAILPGTRPILSISKGSGGAVSLDEEDLESLLSSSEEKKKKSKKGPKKR